MMIIGDKFPLFHSLPLRGSWKCKLNSRIVRARGDKASFRGNPEKEREKRKKKGIGGTKDRERLPADGER